MPPDEQNEQKEQNEDDKELRVEWLENLTGQMTHNINQGFQKLGDRLEAAIQTLSPKENQELEPTAKDLPLELSAEKVQEMINQSLQSALDSLQEKPQKKQQRKLISRRQR